MKIRITYPDGTVEEVEINPFAYRSVAEMAEAVCAELADRWIRRARRRRKRGTGPSREKYIESCTRWLYPQLVSAIAEALEAMGYPPG